MSKNSVEFKIKFDGDLYTYQIHYHHDCLYESQLIQADHSFGSLAIYEVSYPEIEDLSDDALVVQKRKIIHPEEYEKIKSKVEFAIYMSERGHPLDKDTECPANLASLNVANKLMTRVSLYEEKIKYGEHPNLQEDHLLTVDYNDPSELLESRKRCIIS